jgi:hypothetical protein
VDSDAAGAAVEGCGGEKGIQVGGGIHNVCMFLDCHFVSFFFAFTSPCTLSKCCLCCSGMCLWAAMWGHISLVLTVFEASNPFAVFNHNALFFSYGFVQS